MDFDSAAMNNEFLFSSCECYHSCKPPLVKSFKSIQTLDIVLIVKVQINIFELVRKKNT